jgi:hypothetical protein
MNTRELLLTRLATANVVYQNAVEAALLFRL